MRSPSFAWVTLVAELSFALQKLIESQLHIPFRFIQYGISLTVSNLTWGHLYVVAVCSVLL